MRRVQAGAKVAEDIRSNRVPWACANCTVEYCPRGVDYTTRSKMVSFLGFYSGVDRSVSCRRSSSQYVALRPGRIWKRWWAAVASIITLSSFISLSTATAEGDALLQMVQSWGVANALPTWVPGGNPCGKVSWEGVSCNDLGQVTLLSLNNKGLKGPIPKAISSLSSLNSLDLGNFKGLKNGTDNRITGDLSVLSSLSNLQHLNLTYSYAGSNLQFPSAVLRLTGLVTLILDHAGFVGPFPVGISELKGLQYLYLANNSMTGPLPKELSKLEQLVELSLWGIPFDSQIPPDLHFCKKLAYLNLHACELWGGLPPEFGNFKFMKDIQLYRNSLTGPIPERWKNMNFTTLRLDQNSLHDEVGQWILKHPTLESVYLRTNLLYGLVPNVSTTTINLRLDCNYLSGPKPFLNNTTVSSNCFLTSNLSSDQCSKRFQCDQFQLLTANRTCPPCPDSQTLIYNSTCICHKVASASPDEKKEKTVTAAVIASSVAAAAAVSLLGLLLILKCNKRRKQLDDESSPFDPEKSNFSDMCWEPPKGVQRFTFQELEKATGGFSKDHEIGAGGFGKVFCGDFPDGRKLAIKRASDSGSQGIREFRNEVLLLSRLHHKNLVRLEGFCEDKQVLVYEYMSLGNLHNHLFRKEKSQRLDSYKRLDIAVGIARALEYLHTNADPPVIHRDVKPSNILLDQALTAKVADFGISRASSLVATHLSTDPAGTAGYLDPQYFISHQLSTASDVYSFGVVLLELVTGQRAIDYAREDINLMAWVTPKLRRDGIGSIVDPCLEDEYAPDMFFEMADLALRCAAYEKDDRPTMRAVLAILEPLLEAHKTPPSPRASWSTSWEATVGPPPETSQTWSEWSKTSILRD